MKSPSVFLVAALGLAGVQTVGSCAVTCGANAGKLAALRRGMSYEETARIMGCSGFIVAGPGPASAAFFTVEWDGPESMISARTQVDFQDGRLLSYSIGHRGAL